MSNDANQQYKKLEHRLVLLAWLNNLLGYEHNRDLLVDMKQAAEGFDFRPQPHLPPPHFAWQQGASPHR